MPIKMTKELPTEKGWYLWVSCDYDPIPDTFYLDGNGDLWRMPSTFGFRLAMCPVTVEGIGGYWAKLGQDQFEFEG